MSDTQFHWPEGKAAAVSLSFDDAWITQVERGVPILDRFDVKATFYVSFNNLASRIDQWRQVAAHGHEIGNHTLTHPCSENFGFIPQGEGLESFTLDRMEQELLEANRQIKELLDVQPCTFAYPCGQTFVGRGANQRSYVPLVARYFDVGRRAFDEVPNDPVRCDLAMITGVDFDGASWDRVHSLLETTIEEGRWLSLHGHHVSDKPRQCVRPDTLKMICKFCQNTEHAIWINTVANIGSYIRQQRQSNNLQVHAPKSV